jgi:hypothetical protein
MRARLGSIGRCGKSLSSHLWWAPVPWWSMSGSRGWLVAKGPVQCFRPPWRWARLRKQSHERKLPGVRLPQSVSRAHLSRQASQGTSIPIRLVAKREKARVQAIVCSIAGSGVESVRWPGDVNSSFLGYDNCPSVIGGSHGSDDPGSQPPQHHRRERQHFTCSSQSNNIQPVPLFVVIFSSRSIFAIG